MLGQLSGELLPHLKLWYCYRLLSNSVIEEGQEGSCQVMIKLRYLHVGPRVVRPWGDSKNRALRTKKKIPVHTALPNKGSDGHVPRKIQRLTWKCIFAWILGGDLFQRHSSPIWYRMPSEFRVLDFPSQPWNCIGSIVTRVMIPSFKLMLSFEDPSQYSDDSEIMCLTPLTQLEVWCWSILGSVIDC